jgi:hypothetical protein
MYSFLSFISNNITNSSIQSALHPCTPPPHQPIHRWPFLGPPCWVWSPCWSETWWRAHWWRRRRARARVTYYGYCNLGKPAFDIWFSVSCGDDDILPGPYDASEASLLSGGPSGSRVINVRLTTHFVSTLLESTSAFLISIFVFYICVIRCD